MECITTFTVFPNTILFLEGMAVAKYSKKKRG
jgi:hypothetical protein